jgi:hypothetical protein
MGKGRGRESFLEFLEYSIKTGIKKSFFFILEGCGGKISTLKNKEQYAYYVLKKSKRV